MADPPKLLVATGNAGKAREFREMLGADRFTWLDLSSFPDPAPAGEKKVDVTFRSSSSTVSSSKVTSTFSRAGVPQVEETGRTFRANACLKASTYARHFGLWTIADDSGIEIDALGGAPGVLSARWAQVNSAGSGDDANNALVLEQLKGVPDERRTARFVCVLALSRPDGRVIATVRDTIEGRVLHAPRGTNGFGYDPLFYFPEFGKTTAELEPAEKHTISHRGKALRHLREIMDRTRVPG